MFCSFEVVQDEIRKPSVYSIAVEGIPQQRISVYAAPDTDALEAKSRQSITLHNHDFEIVEAKKRRSTVNKNSFVAEKKISLVSVIIPETVPSNFAESADEKAELGKSVGTVQIWCNFLLLMTK